MAPDKTFRISYRHITDDAREEHAVYRESSTSADSLIEELCGKPELYKDIECHVYASLGKHP